MVTPCYSLKDLGVRLDQDLSMSTQVNDLLKVEAGLQFVPKYFIPKPGH